MAMPMRFLDVNGDYYLRKGMELERQRDRLLEQYGRSKNPKTLELLRTVTAECHAIWTTVRLKEYSRFGQEQLRLQNKENPR